jgi:adhesin transport system membrane fusion protein
MIFKSTIYWTKLFVAWLGDRGKVTEKFSLSEQKDRRLLLGFVMLSAAFGLWATLAPVDRIVRAEGRIIAAGRTQIVQHLEGGIVSDILVREGQSVKAGEVLMKLSKVQANTSVQQGQLRLQALKAQQSRLVAEAEGRGDINFSAGIDSVIKLTEQAAFRERSERIRSEQSVLRQQIVQRQEELIEAQSRAKNYAGELEISRKQSALVEGLHKRGAASQMESLEAQSRNQRLESTYSDVVSSIPRLRAAIGETSSRLAESSAKFRADARVELNQINAEAQRILLNVSGDDDRLFRTDVRAPVSGFINRLQFNTIGGVAKPGENLLEITPSEGPLAVEARVRPDDRAALHAGLPTRVIIGAYDYSVYGALNGRLTEVSADTLVDERGGRYYRVVIEANQSQGGLTNEIILPGMTARADIVVGQRRVLSYLLSPLLRFFSQALREAK